MRIELKDATPGTILESEIIRENTKLVSRGQILTASLKKKLEMFGITHIDIVSESLEDDTKEIVSESLGNRIKDALRIDNTAEIRVLTTDIISSVLKSITPEDDFSNLKYDLDTYESGDYLDHSVRTAMFSIALAYLYNKKIKAESKTVYLEKSLLNIYDVGLAALLQDKGKNHYSSDVLNQIEQMAQNEKYTSMFPELKSIPLDRFEDKYVPYYSFCLISKMPEVSRDTKLMVLCSSKEDVDLKAKVSPEDKNIYIGSEIIRICNLYDILLSHFYHMNESLENVTTYLGQAMTTGSINEELTNLFMSEIPLYPIGAKVMLSDGQEAVVVKNFPGYTYTTKPTVKIISTGEKIELRKRTDLTITNLSTKDMSLDQVVNTEINAQKTA